MLWSTLKFDWNRARAFLVTAEEGSLSAAARALGVAQPTVGRQVDALEQELDVLLFDRVGRKLVLTEAGVDLLEHVRAMAAAASQLSLTASGQSRDLVGNVSVTAGEVTAAHHLPPILAELRAEHPGIEVDIVASNRPQDLLRREADIAIRNFRPTHPDLVAKKVKDATGYLYASADYLDRIGRPQAHEDLVDAAFIGFDRSSSLMDRLQSLGFPVTERSFPIVCENQLVQWEMVKAGLGIGVMDAAVGDAQSGVERVLPDMQGVAFPIWLVAHRGLAMGRRVRVVWEALLQGLGGVAKTAEPGSRI